MDIKEPELPNHFFKYMRAEYAIKVLEDKALWFSSAKDFNDPFDGNVNLIDFSPSDKEIEMFLNVKFCGNRASRRKELQKNLRNPNRIATQIAEQTQELFYEAGICSYSEVDNNILLWSHYSDNHKGVCLKFSSSISEIALMTDKVIYKAGYERQNLWTKKELAIHQLIFTKSDDWEYEKEIRSFNLHNRGKVEFKISNLCEIIFGCRIEKNTIAKIKKIVSDLNYTHIKFKQAKLTKSSFKLSFD